MQNNFYINVMNPTLHKRMYLFFDCNKYLIFQQSNYKE